jgi:hypothetical protein
MERHVMGEVNTAYALFTAEVVRHTSRIQKERPFVTDGKERMRQHVRPHTRVEIGGGEIAETRRIGRCALASPYPIAQ